MKKVLFIVAFIASGIGVNAEEYVIPEGVKYVDMYAISNSALTSVTIPSTAINMYLGPSVYGESFSKQHDGKAENLGITLNLSLEEINVASGNPEFSSIDGVLYNKQQDTLITCPAKKSSVSIPSSVKVIGSGAFSSCSSLSSIIIPNGVTEIGASAFVSCTSLNSIILSNSVVSIGNNAFSNCTSLKSITIPSSVGKIDPTSFYFCTSLKEINVEPGNPNYCSVDGVLYSKDKTELICVPSGKFAKEGFDTRSSEAHSEDSATKEIKGVWTANGMYVGEDVNSMNLPSGVYVIDGKKTIIR